MKDDKLVHELTSVEYNTYKLKSGESFDYANFKNAEIFAKTATPIGRMIDKMKAVLKNATRAGSKVIVVTARANFDKKEVFLQTFRNQGIDIDKTYVERAGNLNLGSAAKNKRFIFHKYLKSGEYKRMRLYDDSKDNLRSFLALQKQYPAVSFEAWLVKSNGRINRFR
tara:strand:- start:18632 stop:19135 length:504 start_codon:yes stop_codon:yes gene_type:complete